MEKEKIAPAKLQIRVPNNFLNEVTDLSHKKQCSPYLAAKLCLLVGATLSNKRPELFDNIISEAMLSKF